MMINKLNPLLSVFIFVYILTTPLFAQDTSVTKPQIGTTQKIGDILLFTLPVATFSTTLIIGDKQGSWQFTKGFLLTSAVTYGLKLGVNKQRPDMSNDNSFPSGHAYAIAGFTAASRIDSKKHDILDVLAGAAIGLGSNLLFTTEYQQKHMELTFYSNRKEFLVGFNYNF